MPEIIYVLEMAWIAVCKGSSVEHSVFSFASGGLMCFWLTSELTSETYMKLGINSIYFRQVIYNFGIIAYTIVYMCLS